MNKKKKHQKGGAKPPKTHQKPKSSPAPKPAGKIVLFGMHAVQEALDNPDRDIRALYVAEGVKPPRGNVPVVTVSKKDLDKMCPPGAVHQGIGLDCGDLPEIDVQDLIIGAAKKKNSLIVMLDQVTDPHNVGAIIRSCAAFGVDGVIMQRKHAPELVGVLAKTACGGVEHVPVAYETNLSRALEALKEGGYFAYGLDERGETFIGDMKPGGKVVLVLGAEGPGMRRLVAEHCDALVKLPTKAPIASLNVSNAAAVALYALLPNS